MTKVLIAFGGICAAGALFAILWMALMIGYLLTVLHT
jgi:hypothetical protein